jgi:phosphatidylglycerol---prolipoprotein diacylglyceryl transferase
VHPHLFQFGRVILPTYGFLLALGMIVSLLVCVRCARLLALNTDKIWSVSLLAIILILAGDKILSIVLHWSHYGARSIGLSMLGTPGIASEGLAGLAIAIPAVMIYARRLGLPILRSADAFAPGVALGSAVASIGCLEAGCNYGTPTHLPWAVIFNSPSAVPGTPLGVPLHPTQIYTGVADFALFVFLVWLLHRPHGDGEILGAGLFLGGLSSALLTFFRGDAGTWVFDAIPFTHLVAVAMVLAGAFFWMQRTSSVQAVSRV